MHRRTGWLGLLLVAAFALGSAELSAQQETTTILSGSEISELVDAHGESIAKDRSALRSFLEQERVREIAAQAGIDIEQLEGKAATLSPEDLVRIRPAVRDADAALAGEGLISTIIYIAGIVLIVLILIAVL
jgi:hypothetical protein